MTTILTHLMFEGAAEEAMDFYVSLFPDGEILHVQRNAEGDLAGEVLVARFRIAGREFQCANSPISHDFDFTPSMSIFVECESEEQQQNLNDALSEGGKALMPLGDYGFSKRFSWICDRFGVSWQLNLA